MSHTETLYIDAKSDRLQVVKNRKLPEGRMFALVRQSQCHAVRLCCCCCCCGDSRNDIQFLRYGAAAVCVSETCPMLENYNKRESARKCGETMGSSGECKSYAMQYARPTRLNRSNPSQAHRRKPTALPTQLMGQMGDPHKASSFLGSEGIYMPVRDIPRRTRKQPGTAAAVRATRKNYSATWTACQRSHTRGPMSC